MESAVIDSKTSYFKETSASIYEKKSMGFLKNKTIRSFKLTAILRIDRNPKNS
jgi:hypothetical protein